MSVYLFTKLFYLLVLLLLMGGTLLCGHVWASDVEAPPSPDSYTVELFKTDKNEIIIKFKADGGEETSEKAKKVTVKNYYSPAIVIAGDSFIVLAGVNRTVKSNEGKFNNIVTTYIQSEKLLSSQKFAEIKDSDWVTQFAVKNEAVDNTDEVAKGLLAVAKNNETYLLLVNFSKKTADPANTLELKFGLSVRTLKGGDPAEKKIKWTEKKLTFASVSEKLKKKFKEEKQIDDFVFSGSAFLTDKGKIVFLFVIENSKEKISALINLKNDNELEVLYAETENNCHFYSFPWKNKIIMVPDSCLSNEKKIKELSDVEGTWSASTETSFRYYEFLQDKQDFVTIRNGAKEILLFTEHKPKLPDHSDKKDVILWMSDGIHLHKIGKITVDENTVASINFLFANDKLFFLDQQLQDNEVKSVKLTYLEEQSTRATTIMNAWSTTDAKILELCSGKRNLKVFCNIDGPVGFLFDNYSSNNWNDEYHYVNAIVKNGEKAPEGIKLKGKEGKATWTVFKEKEDQPYNFADSGFTLVATVQIENHDGEAGNSLLGLVLNDENKGFGLWCSNDNKWVVKIKENNAPLEVNQKECSEGKTYIITLVFEKNKNLQIHVDGEQLAVLDKDKIKITASETIKHFYFGVDDETQQATSDVTITNVLLYNWPFEEKENTKLQQIAKANKEREAREKIGGDNNNQPQNKGSTTENGGPPTIPDTQTSTEDDKEDKQSSSPPQPPATEDSAVRAGVVGVLCFMLFGVFTLLGRYVY